MAEIINETCSRESCAFVIKWDNRSIEFTFPIRSPITLRMEQFNSSFWSRETRRGKIEFPSQFITGSLKEENVYMKCPIGDWWGLERIKRYRERVCFCGCCKGLFKGVTRRRLVQQWCLVLMGEDGAEWKNWRNGNYLVPEDKCDRIEWLAIELCEKISLIAKEAFKKSFNRQSFIIKAFAYFSIVSFDFSKGK